MWDDFVLQVSDREMEYKYLVLAYYALQRLGFVASNYCWKSSQFLLKCFFFYSGNIVTTGFTSEPKAISNKASFSR
jgi:hypothetical protein